MTSDLEGRVSSLPATPKSQSRSEPGFFARLRSPFTDLDLLCYSLKTTRRVQSGQSLSLSVLDVKKRKMQVGLTACGFSVV